MKIIHLLTFFLLFPIQAYSHPGLVRYVQCFPEDKQQPQNKEKFVELETYVYLNTDDPDHVEGLFAFEKKEEETSSKSKFMVPSILSYSKNDKEKVIDVKIQVSEHPDDLEEFESWNLQIEVDPESWDNGRALKSTFTDGSQTLSYQCYRSGASQTQQQ